MPATSMLAATAPSAMPTSELKRYVRGVIAHVAIQTSYRLQHPGNMVVCERRPWVGDTSSSTISKYLDVLDSGLTAAEVLTRGVPRTAVDVTSFFLYVLNDSTLDWSSTKTGRLVYKRYDICDLGPLANLSKGAASKALAANLLQGEAYEIKSSDSNEQKKGAAYIKGQVDRFNKSIDTYGGAVASALKISGIEKYRLREGTSWPPTQQILWLGKSILIYWRVPSMPGVISYKWDKFDPRSLRRMWQLYRKVSRQVQKNLERRPSLRPATVAAAALAIAVAVAFTGLVIAGIAEAAAGAIVVEELGTAAALGTSAATSAATSAGTSAAAGTAILAPRATILLLEGAAGAGVLMPATVFANTPVPGAAAADAGQAPDAGQGDGGPARAAFRYATQPRQVDERLFAAQPASSGGGLPGGTPATPDESFVALVIDSLVREILHRYGVQAGQGDEDLFDDEAIAIVRDNLTSVVSGLVAEIGTDGLRELFGIDENAQNAEEEVGVAVAQFAATILESSGGAQYFAALFELSDNDFERMLPLEYNEDGERPE
jgi:hypothetical protein